ALTASTPPYLPTLPSRRSERKMREVRMDRDGRRWTPMDKMDQGEARFVAGPISKIPPETSVSHSPSLPFPLSPTLRPTTLSAPPRRSRPQCRARDSANRSAVWGADALNLGELLKLLSFVFTIQYVPCQLL